jgi:hypothetical protein
MQAPAPGSARVPFVVVGSCCGMRGALAFLPGGGNDLAQRVDLLVGERRQSPDRRADVLLFLLGQAVTDAAIGGRGVVGAVFWCGVTTFRFGRAFAIGDGGSPPFLDVIHAWGWGRVGDAVCLSAACLRLWVWPSYVQARAWPGDDL